MMSRDKSRMRLRTDTLTEFSQILSMNEEISFLIYIYIYIYLIFIYINIHIIIYNNKLYYNIYKMYDIWSNVINQSIKKL